MAESGGPLSYEERAKAARNARAEKKEKMEARKGNPVDNTPDPDAWMVTFSDLLTLLMTFFVLIFASQDPVKEKIFEAFGQTTGVFGLFRTSFFEEITVVPRRDISQDRVEILLDEIGAVDIDVLQDERGLVISLPSNAIFAPGSATLIPKAVERIGKLADYLKDSRHHISVEGHTDDRELARGPPGREWDLSVERAHAVLTELVRHEVDERRLSLGGFGPSRPRFDNVSRLGRQRNRRVEIVIFTRGENP